MRKEDAAKAKKAKQTAEKTGTKKGAKGAASREGRPLLKAANEAQAERQDEEMAGEDMIIQEAELVALLAEAGPDGTRDNSLDTARVLSRPIHSTDSGSNFTSEKQMRLDQRNAALTEIYHHHGWPRRDFDKSRCIETLLTWASDERLRRVTRQ